MEIIWDISNGWPSQIDVNGRLGLLTRPENCSVFRLGITGNPYQVASRYESDFDELIVLFQSDLEHQVRETDRYLTYYFWDYCDNSMNTGEALIGPPYYLYLVRRRTPHPEPASAN